MLDFITIYIQLQSLCHNYSIDYLENKNKFYVSKWNDRVRNAYRPNLYENIIDYDYNKHYGLEVNYKLYNYFKFVEKEYDEKI